MHHVLDIRESSDVPWKRATDTLKHPPEHTLRTYFALYNVVNTFVGAQGAHVCEYTAVAHDGRAMQARITLVGSCCDGTGI